MKVDFEYSRTGWQLTPRVAELFKHVKHKQEYLHEAFAELQSKVNVLVKDGVISDVNMAHIIISDNYGMATEKVCLCAICAVSGKYLDREMIVRVELHIMMPDEYRNFENGNPERN